MNLRYSGDSTAPEFKIKFAFCGYCGERMREILEPSPEFDRATGKQGRIGSMYWQCPNRGIGLDAMHGDWSREGWEQNPHDFVFLRQVMS